MEDEKTMTVKKEFLLSQLQMKAIFAGIIFLITSISYHPGFAQGSNSTAQGIYQQALSSNKFSDKIALLEQALRLAPDSVSVRLELGKARIQLQQFSLAVAQLDTALSYDSENTEIWCYKGLAHTALQEIDDANSSLEEIKAREKNLPRFYFNQGIALYKSRAFDVALTVFELMLAATDSASIQSQAGFWLGRTYEAKQDTASAINSYNEALELRPDFADAKRNLKRIATKPQTLVLVDTTITPAQKNNSEFVKTDPPEIQQKKLDKTDKVASTKKPETKPKPEAEPPTENNAPLTMDDATETGEVSSSNEPWLPLNMKDAVVITVALVLIVVLLIYNKKPKRISTAPIQLQKLKNQIKSIVEKKKRMAQTDSAETLLVISRYQIERELGHGGFGKVYKAYDTKLKRVVALKVVTLTQTMTASVADEYVKRFREEAVNTAKLSHPNIVTLYDFDEKQGLLYITMEYIKGVSVSDLLKTQKRLPVSEAIHIVTETCHALAFAHQLNIVHRDMKPGNIMLDLDAQVKVVDFGIAKDLLKDEAEALTSGMMPLTPGYASPEQSSLGVKLDGRSDIFSLGIVFYEMLIGQKPYVFALTNQKIPGPSSIFKDIPKSVDAIIKKMLTAQPDKRYTKVEEIISALNSV